MDTQELVHAALTSCQDIVIPEPKICMQCGWTIPHVFTQCANCKSTQLQRHSDLLELKIAVELVARGLKVPYSDLACRVHEQWKKNNPS